MFRKIVASFIFCYIFCMNFPVFCEELKLVAGKTYLLQFDERIENINYNKNLANVQILHTILGDANQIILSLNENTESFLQVKTSNNYYNYELKNSKIISDNLLEIDIPPIENFEVDVLEFE